MNIIANGKTDSHSENVRKVDEMLCNEPASVDRLNWLLYIQHVRGEVTSCKQLIKDEIAKSNGKNEYAFYKEGIILREEGKIQEALEAFQTCHKLNSGNVDNVKEIAKCLFLLKRYRLAFEAYTEAEKSSDKADWEIFHNVGECLILLGNIPKAREYVNKAVQCGKQETSYALLIKILLMENDIRSAVAVCNAALEVCPDSVDMLSKSGLLYIKTGQTQLAFERLSSGLALNPTCAEALLGIGCITQSHEEYDVALTKYKLAVQHRPDSVALWNNIGMCFYSKQKYIAAITCLKRALWLSPLNARILLNLGMVHLSTQQPASAFNFLCAAVNLRPDAAVAFILLGCTLLLLEDPENALKAMRHACTLAQDQPIVILDTAVLCYKNGLTDETVELVMKFEQLIGKQNNETKPLELVSLAERLKAVIAAGVLEQSEGVDNGIDLGTIPTVDGATTKAGEFSQNAGKEENVVDEAIAVGKANNGVVRIDELRPNNEELFDGGKTQQKREHSSEAELSDPDEV